MPNYVAVKTLEDYCRIPASDIKELNPVLEPSVFKSGGLIPKGYQLNLWPEQKIAFESNYSSIPSALKYRHIAFKAEHRVKKGQTLSKIAKMYRTTVNRIKKINNIRNTRKLRRGQVLKIPGDYVSLDHKEPLKSQKKASRHGRPSDAER